jgi:hypothetical protein
MKHLKRLLATLGTFTGIAILTLLTMACANKVISMPMFLVGAIITTAIELVCVGYINKECVASEWSD